MHTHANFLKKYIQTYHSYGITHIGENTFMFSESIIGGVSGTNVVGDCRSVALHIGQVRFLLYINQDRMHAL